jgi:phage gpG-like protein
MNVSLSIQGADLVRKQLDLKGKEIDKAVKRAIDRTALAIESDAKKKLRDDGHIITGRLRASIHAELKSGVTNSYTDSQGRSYDGSLQKDIAADEAIVGTNVEYAPYIEFGSKNFKGDSFLGWASLKQMKLLQERVAKEINKILKR